MGKITGFLDYERHEIINRDYKERLNDFDEMYAPINDAERKRQGARCMDCGVPFCQSDYGCPVDNLIPEWNELIHQGKWREAYMLLRKTNNFPEYTGRICPAPCESACVLAINEPAVTIKDNEVTIIDHAYEQGWVTPIMPTYRSGKSIAIVGSGPAGLSSADQLNQMGHTVTVYERDDRIGGLLMYGIPNMKLDKKLVERRNKIMEQEGIQFKVNIEIGKDITLKQLHSDYDAVLIATGATQPKDLLLPKRDLPEIHFAMDYLYHVTKCLLDNTPVHEKFMAKEKEVIVIGSGDTGTDCIATAARQRAKRLINFGWRDPPPVGRSLDYPWPLIPKELKFDYAHKEVNAAYGNDPRNYNILTKEFIADNGHLRGVKTIEVKWHKDPMGKPYLEEVSGSERVWNADLILIALGYTGPERNILDSMGIEISEDGSVKGYSSPYRTSVDGIFSAGDARRGQSLVVWAIHEGREVADEIHRYVRGK